MNRRDFPGSGDCSVSTGWIGRHLVPLQTQLLTMLAEGLAAFHQDMGAEMATVTVAVMSEFGRWLSENSSIGTDRGHGSMMMPVSGNLQANGVVT